MLLFIRLAVEEGSVRNIYILLFIYFAPADNFRNPCQLSLSQKEGKERGRGKIGIITHVRTYMRT